MDGWVHVPAQLCRAIENRHKIQNYGINTGGREGRERGGPIYFSFSLAHCSVNHRRTFMNLPNTLYDETHFLQGGSYPLFKPREL